MASSEALERAWIHYGGRFPARGKGRVKANCPLHEDKNASASLNLDTGKWVCYAGCGFGDVYDLIGLAEGVGFVEAKALAVKNFGDQVTQSSSDISGQNPLVPASGKTRKRGPSWK